MSKHYTNEDIESAGLAAHRRNCEDSWDDCREYGGHCVRAAEEALDTVAPKIAARALREAAEGCEAYPLVGAWLRLRADEIEGGR